MTKTIALLLTGTSLALVGCQGGLGGGGLAPASEVRPRAITQEDRQQGAQANAEFLREFGGAYDGKLAAYVRQIGQKIAFESSIANSPSDFTITLLNSPVSNAFAIPGGYVYITRQLAGLLNTEAEMAFVLGHEVGHVAAGHSQSRQSRSTTTGLLGVLGQVLAGAVLGNSAAGQILQQGIGGIAQATLLGFSRAQEYQADDLGILYLRQAGYDPYAAANALTSLALQNSLNARLTGDNRTLPEWASTHPDPGARVDRARQRAQVEAAGVTASGITNRAAYLDALDSMLYDDDPQQGVVRGTQFLHPVLRFRFTAPQGYTLANGATAVSVTGQNGQAQLQGGGAVSSSGLDGYVAKVFAGLGSGATQAPAVQRTTINGLPVAFAVATAQTQQGAVDVGVVAYALNGQGYHFLTLAPAGQGLGPFNAMIQSFGPLSASDAAAIRARVIDVVTVRSGDTAAGLAQRMAYDSYQLERFLVLNGLTDANALRAGEKVKIVRDR